MRRSLVAIFFFASLTRAFADGAVRDATFHSDALGVDKHYQVWLPSGYDAGKKRYPVIYMLHGLGGDERNWVERGHIDKAADKLGLQAILVMPDGDASFYVDSATPADYDKCMKAASVPFLPPEMARESFCVRSPKYETYLTKDLVGHVDATYRTVAERRGRAIGGLSMGGFGALNAALRHKDEYSAVASHSGVASMLYAGPRPYEKGKGRLASDIPRFVSALGEYGPFFQTLFGTELSSWQAHDPTTLAASLKPGELAIYLDCGTEDDIHLDANASYLDEVLSKQGIAHTFVLVPGHHNFDLWIQRVPESLRFFADTFHKAGL